MTDPLVTALFLVAAFMSAGVLHSLWLASSWSRSLAIPIDGGLRVRGRPLFGENKMVRGFVVMVPAAGAAFWVLGVLLDATSPPLRVAIWPLGNGELALLGTWAGLGFMLGELPNSFIKRQLGIAAGTPPSGRLAQAVSFAADRLDSIIGMLLAISLVAPTPWMTWVYVIVLGPGIHFAYSALLHRLGVKARAA